VNERDAKKYKAEAGMEPCWIVWEAASDGGRPYLIAVDTSEEQAAAHVRQLKDEARLRDKPPPMIKIEESWLDHRYGESMTKSFDEAKKMVREVQRAQIVELKAKLRRAIDLARENYLSPTKRDELADLEKAL